MSITRLFFLPIIVLMVYACGTNESDKSQQKLSIDQLFKKHPDSVPILIEHGNVMLKRYDFDKALQDGAKAYRLQPNNLAARFLYANALNNRASRTVSDVATAQKHFKYILKKEPKNLPALVALASTYSQQGDYDKAFYHANEALRIDKHYRDAYTLKGTLYRTLGKGDLAKSSYQTAIDQDPNFFEAYLQLGVLYQEEKNPLAIQYFTTATQLRPNSMDALYNLAFAHQEFNQIKEAQETYRAMLKKDPDFSTSLFQLGCIKQNQEKDLDSAIYFFNETLTKEPRFVEAWHNLGYCTELKGNKYQAIQYYQKALKYNPDFELSIEAITRLSK